MPNYELWSIWIELPALPKLFLLILAVIGFYSLISAAVTLARLRSIMNPSHSRDTMSLRRAVGTLQVRCANVRQLIGAAFYLFGIVFFFSLRFAFVTFDSHTPVGTLILRDFFLYFAFAANAFFIFLVLHLVQWFVSRRVWASALQSEVSIP